MVRFVDGVPKYVWMSQHGNGEAHKFKALEKDESGKRVGFNALFDTTRKD